MIELEQLAEQSTQRTSMADQEFAKAALSGDENYRALMLVRNHRMIPIRAALMMKLLPEAKFLRAQQELVLPSGARVYLSTADDWDSKFNGMDIKVVGVDEMAFSDHDQQVLATKLRARVLVRP